jgi:purine nucleosidase
MPSDPPKRTIIVDSDPGLDDAVAILFALAAQDRLDLLAITTVAGNVPLGLTSRNARIVLDWANREDVPVYAGCPRPLVRDLVTAQYVHGMTGLGSMPLHEPKAKLAENHAVDFLIQKLRSVPERSVTLCFIGPLTNLAAALIQAPDVTRGIEGLVIMGGAYLERGNITPTAEFNIFVDPHATDVVLASGIPLTVLPLDVTHKVLSTRSRIRRLESLGSRTGKLIAAILLSYAQGEDETFEAVPLHDPCVIAYLLKPSLFSGRRVNVTIETGSDLTLGETVVDWREVTQRSANALWIDHVDADGFYALLTETASRAD